MIAVVDKVISSKIADSFHKAEFLEAHIINYRCKLHCCRHTLFHYPFVF